MSTTSLRSNLFTMMLCLGIAGMIGACATAGKNSDDADGSVSIDGPSASCGNNALDPGEMCDGSNLNNEDCTTRGFEGGNLACNVATCSFVTDACYRCGNDVIDGAEDCDGAALGGETCQTQGYLGGTLDCNATCGFDISGCQTSETLRNDDGNCPSVIGCSTNDGSGTSGNPQNLVECFRSASLAPPFWLDTMSYTLSSADAAPNALNIEVYAWTGSGPPGALLGSTAAPANALGAGPHTVTLASPIEITSADFCIGLNGTDPADGFRILFSDTSTVFGASYIRASVCGAADFTAVSNVVGPGNWCMSATIDKAQP